MSSEHRQMTPDSNLKMWVTLSLSLALLPSKINRKTFFQAINIYNCGSIEKKLYISFIFISFHICLLLSISTTGRITVYKSALLKGRQSFDPRKWAVKSLFYISLADKNISGFRGTRKKDASIHIQSILSQSNKSRIIGEWSRQ